jgi:hypothetical protein
LKERKDGLKTEANPCFPCHGFTLKALQSPNLPVHPHSAGPPKQAQLITTAPSSSTHTKHQEPVLFILHNRSCSSALNTTKSQHRRRSQP